MQNILKAWFKYFIFVGIFGLCINLIYLVIPVYFMVVYDRVLFSFSRATLYTLVIGVLIGLLVMMLLDYIRTKMLSRAGNDIVEKWISSVLNDMQSKAVAGGQNGYGRGLSDLELLRDAIVRGNIFYILELPWIFVYLAILYIMHPLVGMVAVGGFLLVTLFQILLRTLERKRYTAADVTLNAGTDFISHCLNNAELVSALGMESAVLKKYRVWYNKALRAKSEADSFHSIIGGVIRMLYLVSAVAVFSAGAFVFFEDEISSGVIFASVMIILRLFYPFDRSLTDMKSSIEAMAAYKRLKTFINEKPDKIKLSLPAPEGKVTTESISLAIDGRAILHNIGFELLPGECLGVYGPSSAGKTSLCKVLLGIWPPSAGKVRLDGAQIIQWPKDELGKYVGYLPQETSLFPGTVAENISRLGTVDSEKVVKAAQKTGVHDIILKLAQGYDTRIDQNGTNLAAGQRQLISLARACYNDPKLVVLDEPHTHLDDMGLTKVLHTLNNLKQDKVSTIVITDRIHLLMNMDKILVLKDGQVAIYGPGKEVIAKLTNKKQPQQAAGV